jgi:hypothetical protein
MKLTFYSYYEKRIKPLTMIADLIGIVEYWNNGKISYRNSET